MPPTCVANRRCSSTLRNSALAFSSSAVRRCIRKSNVPPASRTARPARLGPLRFLFVMLILLIAALGA